MKYTIRKITALIIALMLAMPGVVTADETIAVDGGAIQIDDAGIDTDGLDLVLDGDGLTVEDLDGLLSDGTNGLALDGLVSNLEDATGAPAPFEQTVKAGDVAFTLSAEAGAFPEGASLRVSDILDETLSSAATDAAETILPDGVKQHRLYQIEVIDQDGNICPINAEMTPPSVCVEGLNPDEATKVLFYDPVEKQGREIETEIQNEKNLRFGFIGSGVYDVLEEAENEETPADPYIPTDSDTADDTSTDQKPSPAGGPSARESVQWTDSSEDGSEDPRNGGTAQSAVTDEVPSPGDSSDTPDGESDTDTPSPLPVAVIFTLTPGDAQLTIHPVATNEAPESAPDASEPDGAYDPAPVSPEPDGTYLLVPGEYAYAASAEGYIAVEDVPFTVEASEEPLAISVTLEPEPEPEPVPFDQTLTVNGVAVTVRAPAGAFPANAALSVKRVPSYKVKQAGAAIEEVREDDQNVAVSYTFDIKVVDPDTNEALQPAGGFNVEVSFALSEANDENLEASVYHVTGESGAMTAEKLDADVDEGGETVTATSDGFSIYTVEFTYNNLEYVLRGGGSVALSKILAAVGLSGTAAAVEVSDESLFSASQENGDWIVESHESFSTDEWMRVTVGDIRYTINVTSDLVENISYIGPSGETKTCASATVVDSNTTS